MKHQGERTQRRAKSPRKTIEDGREPISSSPVLFAGPDLPEEALGACLVALVAAVAIWIVYLIVRVLGRVALFGLKHGPRIFSLAR